MALAQTCNSFPLSWLRTCLCLPEVPPLSKRYSLGLYQATPFPDPLRLGPGHPIKYPLGLPSWGLLWPPPESPPSPAWNPEAKPLPFPGAAGSVRTNSVEHTHWDLRAQGKLWVNGQKCPGLTRGPYLFPVHGSALLAPLGVSHKQILCSPHRATTVF